MTHPPTTHQEPQTIDHSPLTILVTGGAGFIGSNFIRYILREHPDWIVINLDKLTYAGNLANLTDIEANYGLSAVTHHSSPITRYYFVRGSITDRNLVDSIFSGTYFTSQGVPPTTHHPLPTAVINFAAESHVDRSIIDATPFIETNVKGTQVLLDAARAHWLAPNTQSLRPKTFLQISTDEVYGALGETGVFTEESPLLPNSPYAASKAAAELLCRAYHKTYGLPVVITRSSNNYGPYQFPEKLIPLMIRNALNGKPLPVYGEGKQVRDWLYVEDNCRAIDLVLQKGNPGEVYNIGGGCEKRNIEVVQMICDILEEKLKEISKRSEVDSRLSTIDPQLKHRLPTPGPRLSDLIKFIEDPRGAAHDFRYALDSSKINEKLGWEPQVDFNEGLERTIEWYLENQDWVEGVITGEYQEYYQKVYGSK